MKLVHTPLGAATVRIAEESCAFSGPFQVKIQPKIQT